MQLLIECFYSFVKTNFLYITNVMVCLNFKNIIYKKNNVYMHIPYDNVIILTKM